jgi:hypothetical protein
VCDTVAPVPVVLSPKLHEYEVMVPSVSDPDPMNEHVSPAHEYVNDAVGGWFGGLPPVSTILGANTEESWTSSSGSWMPSPDSSVQLKLPFVVSVEYRPATPLQVLEKPFEARSASAPATCGDAIDVPLIHAYPPFR